MTGVSAYWADIAAIRVVVTENREQGEEREKQRRKTSTLVMSGMMRLDKSLCSDILN